MKTRPYILNRSRVDETLDVVGCSGVRPFSAAAVWNHASRPDLSRDWFEKCLLPVIPRFSPLQRAAGGDGRTPGKSRSAFTLIEMVAVLAIIALLATLLLPRMIKRIDLSTRATEVARLATIADALKSEVMRNRTVPDTNGWRQAAAQGSGLSVPDVTLNARHYQRVYYFQSASTPPDDAVSPYLYLQTTNGTAAPANLRAMIVSILGGPQFSAGNSPAPNGGVLSDADFNHLWNLADGARPTAGNWSAWTGAGDDFLVQRLDYAPLFHHLLLVNRDPASTWFTIDGSAPLRLDRLTNNPGWGSYLVEGTVVGLCDTSGSVMAQHILRGDISFVFEAGLWRAQLLGAYTGVGAADDFAEEAATFMSSQWNSKSAKSDQQGVLVAMYSFMYIYTLWGNQSPHFGHHGATANQVPEYKMLRDIADDNARLDSFTDGLLNRTGQ